MLVKDARETQLRKLRELEAYTPCHLRKDQAKGGIYKSRFTCADVKCVHAAEEEQNLKEFVCANTHSRGPQPPGGPRFAAGACNADV